MLIDLAVSITMIGGIIPHADAGTAVALMNPAMSLNPTSDILFGGHANVTTGISLSLQANAIISGIVNINPPSSG